MRVNVRKSSERVINRRGVFIAMLAMLIPVGTLAQTSTQEPEAARLQKELQEMRSQMNKLQSQIDELEAAKTQQGTTTGAQPAAPQNPPTLPQGPTSPQVGEATTTFQTFSEDPVAAARYGNVPLDPKYHGYFILPGTQTLLKIGGYFKSDFIYDLKPAGNTDEFIPSSIPIPQVKGVNNANVSIRPTRLNFDFRIPNSRAGDVRFFVEGDFFGTNSTTPRLRHAYAQARNLLIGQTFSNFMDPDATPDLLDFRAPNGMINLRNPQFRYTIAVGERTTFSLSVEKPTSDLTFKTPQFTAQPNSPSPDGTVRLRQEFQRGHWQVASVFRSIAAFLPDGRTDSVFGWGINASGALRTFRRDTIVVQGAYGEGISRYIQDTSGLGIDAEVSTVPKPHLKASPAVGAYGAYQHYWSKVLRSNFIYGYAHVQNTAFPPGSTFRKSDYGAGNIIWNPFGSLNVGAEFLYGWQVLKNGQSGNAPRFQFSAKYSFVKIDRDKK